MNLESELFIAQDRAQQIAIDSSGGEGADAKQRVDDLRDRVKDVLKEVEDRSRQCEKLLQEREDFEDIIGSTISWLEQKEDVLATRQTLDLDSNKVDPVLSKHQVYCTQSMTAQY